MRPADDFTKITTDETFQETRLHGREDYPFGYYLEDIWQFDFHCIDWHWHPEAEFVYVAKGTVLCFAGTEKIELSQGSGIFINSGVLHRFEASENVLIPNIVFSSHLFGTSQSRIYRKYVQPVLNSTVTYQAFQPEIPWQKEILRALNRIFYLQETVADNEMQTIETLFQLWNILFQNVDFTSEAPGSRRMLSRQSRLQIMIQFIHTSYREPITLEEIAASVSISKNTALQIFQSGIHTSPVTYLIQYRLTRAAELLSSTEKTVTAIAAETGFTNAGYFCRKFKEHYHVTPRAYRMRKQ